MKDAFVQETLRAVTLVSAAFWLTTGVIAAKYYWNKAYTKL